MINPEDMTEEEIEAFNKQEQEKADKRKAQQAKNRKKARGTASPTIQGIKKVKGKDYIRCVCLRKMGTDDGMAEIGEEVDLPKTVAARLQDSGIIKVKL